MEAPPLNIVVPMAGLGSRFAEAGYTLPKPLIPIHGVPMIRLVIENIRPKQSHRFCFVLQDDTAMTFDLEARLQSWAPDCLTKRISGLTEGPASTVLLGLDRLSLDAPLLIANCDQFVEASIDDFLRQAEPLDGLIMTMTDTDPKWSYVAINDEGLVTRLAEKTVISDQATVGIYYFRSTRSFVECATEMIQSDERVNGEFYVGPVYNRIISKGGAVKAYPVGKPSSGMHGLGIPKDLDQFLSHPASQAAVRGLQNAGH